MTYGELRKVMKFTKNMVNLAFWSRQKYPASDGLAMYTDLKMHIQLKKKKLGPGKATKKKTSIEEEEIKTSILWLLQNFLLHKTTILI